jgi:predicted transcriptional regulator of viral defense system
VESYLFRLVKLRPARFFGYVLQSQGPYEFPIADREKAIVDSLWRPALAGGTEEVYKCLREAIDELRLEVVESYALRMNSSTLTSRLGYLLEQEGIHSKRLIRGISSSYIKLDPREPRRGRFSSRWKLIDNLPRLE